MPATQSAPGVLASLRLQCMDHLDGAAFPAAEWLAFAREQAEEAVAAHCEFYAVQVATDTLDIVTAGFLADIAAHRAVLDAEADQFPNPSTEEFNPMNVYAYRAALVCAPCATDIIARLPPDADTGDGGDFPQGPYANGGGEADTPQHCDYCNVFLGNPLTWEGEAYARNAMRCWRAAGREASSVIANWSEFYGLEA